MAAAAEARVVAEEANALAAAASRSAAQDRLVVASRREPKVWPVLRHRRRTYVAFLDIKQAFDTVDRPALYLKLGRLGVTGKLLRMLRAMLSGTRQAVMLGGWRSRRVETSRGLQAGARSSPELWKVYADDLITDLRAGRLGVVTLGVWLGLLGFADDLALVAGSAAELQQMLAVAERWARRWLLEFGVSKCAVMVLGGTEGGVQFVLAGERLAVVDHHRWLGVEVDQALTGDLHAENRIKKMRDLIGSLVSVVAARTDVPPGAAVEVLRACVLPAVLYGMELFELTGTRVDHMERLLAAACRRVLAVPKKTAAVVVRGELGLPSMREQLQAARLRLFGRLRWMDERSLPRQLLASLWRNGPGWCAVTRRVVEQYGMDCDAVESHRHWRQWVRHRVAAVEAAAWIAQLQAKSTGRPFAVVHRALRLAEHLRLQNRVARKAVLLRWSALRMEAARGLGVVRAREKRDAAEKARLRRCDRCAAAEVDDAKHALLHCADGEAARVGWCDAVVRHVQLLSGTGSQLAKACTRWLLRWRAADDAEKAAMLFSGEVEADVPKPPSLLRLIVRGGGDICCHVRSF